MSRGAALAAVCSLVAAVLTALVIGSAAAATPVRIMPLGDSITGSPGCWRAYLWNSLQENGYQDIDFVGTLPPQGCGVTYDGDNEGHGGALVTAVAAQNQLVGWLAASRPDVVLMHFGTNDVWSNVAPATILAAYSTLVDQMRASNPGMRIVVSQLIPMNPGTCGDCAARVVALNEAIPDWASGKSTSASPIVVVDQWTGFSTASDTSDGVHPVDSGNRKIAAKLLPVVSSLLGSTPPPTTSPPPSTGGCEATYTTVRQWQGGFQGEVSVTNRGTAALSGWTTTFTLPAGMTIGQAWNAEVARNGSEVTARNVSWNGALAPGAGTSFGFTGGVSGVYAEPAMACR
jgi:lysophospholipase L1-like esterase